MSATTAELTELHEYYIAAVNAAVADNDSRRATELADAYERDALGLLLGHDVPAFASPAVAAPHAHAPRFFRRHRLRHVA